MKYIYSENISKNKYTRKIIVCILIFICFATDKTAHSQNCLADVLHDPLYSNSKDIINGTKWIYEKKYLGSPMLVENYWPRVNILYKEVQYSRLFMNYDLYNDQAIVFYPENGNEKYVNLEMEYFSGFTFIDTITGRIHKYEYLELPGTKGKELYETALTVKIPLFIRPVKMIENRSSEKGSGRYTTHFDSYIGIGNEYVIIRHKNQMIKLLEHHLPEIKRYIRKNHLKINSQNPEDIVAVIKYFDTLK